MPFALGPFIAWLLGNLPTIINVLRSLHAADTMEDSKPDTDLESRLRERLRLSGVLVTGRVEGDLCEKRTADPIGGTNVGTSVGSGG